MELTSLTIYEHVSFAVSLGKLLEPSFIKLAPYIKHSRHIFLNLLNHFNIQKKRIEWSYIEHFIL